MSHGSDPAFSGIKTSICFSDAKQLAHFGEFRTGKALIRIGRTHPRSGMDMDVDAMWQ